MQRHDDRDSLFPRHTPQGFEQLELIPDVEIGGRLIEDDDLRLLTEGPRQGELPLLPVADLAEILRRDGPARA